VGWSLLIAIAGFGAVRSRWARACFAVHPLLMAVAVTATGNHFFFDCVGGAAVALATLALLRVRRRRAGAEVLVLPVAAQAPVGPRRLRPRNRRPGVAISPMRSGAVARRFGPRTRKPDPRR